MKAIFGPQPMMIQQTFLHKQYISISDTPSHLVVLTSQWASVSEIEVLKKDCGVYRAGTWDEALQGESIEVMLFIMLNKTAGF